MNAVFHFEFGAEILLKKQIKFSTWFLLDFWWQEINSNFRDLLLYTFLFVWFLMTGFLCVVLGVLELAL